MKPGASSCAPPRASLDPSALDWDKQGGLLPAVVQHADTLQVLMLGYMDRAALDATLATRRVTFYSRSRQRPWTKGETSGNFLDVAGIGTDCDGDALLVRALPHGPTCHRGTSSCFAGAPANFLAGLDALIGTRVRDRPPGSYTTRLLEAGIARMAQKVGEEGVEVALAAVTGVDADASDDTLLDESADLVYHLLVLLRARGYRLCDLTAKLAGRHAPQA